MAGQNHQSQNPGLSQNQPPLKCCCWRPGSSGAGNIIWMGDEHIPKQLLFGELAQGQRKQGQPWKHYKRHTEEHPEVVCHQAFWTQHSSPCLPPLACTYMHSKCITEKRATSRTACSPWSLPQSCFCPCHNNGLPVSHLSLTL